MKPLPDKPGEGVREYLGEDASVPVSESPGRLTGQAGGFDLAGSSDSAKIARFDERLEVLPCGC